jgi:hypothetical protein
MMRSSMKLILSLAAATWIVAGVVTPPALPQESKAPPITALKATRLFDG